MGKSRAEKLADAVAVAPEIVRVFGLTRSKADITYRTPWDGAKGFARIAAAGWGRYWPPAEGDLIRFDPVMGVTILTRPRGGKSGPP